MANSKTKTPRVKAKFTSWAMPTPEDDALWDSMTREEQLDALRELANHPDTNTATDTTVAEIVERTRAARKAKQAKDGHNL